MTRRMHENDPWRLSEKLLWLSVPRAQPTVRGCLMTSRILIGSTTTRETGHCRSLISEVECEPKPASDGADTLDKVKSFERI